MAHTDETYNGWTNYATWRVNLEMFDGYDPEGHKISPEYLRELTEDMLTEEVGRGEPSFALSYAFAFLQDVNWQEIADRINTDHEVE